MHRRGFVPVAALIAIAVLALAGGGFYALRSKLFPRSGDFACTQEAKICPDGSAVGRTGPNCEFAACPGEPSASSTGGSSPSPSPAPLTVSLGQQVMLGKGQVARVGGTGFEVEIIEFYDSPCPPEVVCAWEGVGIAFEYRLNGKSERSMGPGAFGYRVDVVKTDYETYADVFITEASLLSSIRAISGAQETKISNTEVEWYLAPGAACASARQSAEPVTRFYFKVDRGDLYTPPDECSVNRANVETSILGRLSRYGWSEIQCGVEPPPIIRIFKRGEAFAYLDLHKGCAGGVEDSADISLSVQGN